MKNSPKAIAVQQRQRNDFLRVSDGDSEGIIPPICALCMNWSNAERKSESDVLMTDCPRGLPAVSSANKKVRIGPLTSGLLVIRQVSPQASQVRLTSRLPTNNQSACAGTICHLSISARFRASSSHLWKIRPR